MTTETTQKETEFQVLGSRILLSVPAAPESVIELTEEGKQARHMEFVMSLKSLEVFATGEDVTKVKKGDNVYVPPGIAVSGDKVMIDGQVKLLLGERDVAIIW